MHHDALPDVQLCDTAGHTHAEKCIRFLLRGGGGTGQMSLPGHVVLHKRGGRQDADTIFLYLRAGAAEDAVCMSPRELRQQTPRRGVRSQGEKASRLDLARQNDLAYPVGSQIFERCFHLPDAEGPIFVTHAGRTSIRCPAHTDPDHTHTGAVSTLDDHTRVVPGADDDADAALRCGGGG